MKEQPTSNQRISDARLDHLIRIAEMDCRQTSVLLNDGGYSEGNIPAAQLRALTELRERRAVETSSQLSEDARDAARYRVVRVSSITGAVLAHELDAACDVIIATRNAVKAGEQS